MERIFHRRPYAIKNQRIHLCEALGALRCVSIYAPLWLVLQQGKISARHHHSVRLLGSKKIEKIKSYLYVELSLDRFIIF